MKKVTSYNQLQQTGLRLPNFIIMSNQLKLFKIEPIISPDLKDLIHGSESFDLALQVAKGNNVNKLALFVECIKRGFKDCNDLDWLSSPYVNKHIFKFDFFGILVIVCECDSEDFWLGMYESNKDGQKKALLELKFDTWNNESETWDDKSDLKERCIREIYKNSFQFTNVLKDIY